MTKGVLNMLFVFTPKIGEDEPILTFACFSEGLVQPPTSSGALCEFLVETESG